MEQLSLFGDGKKIIEKKKSIILSASRMTDMPKYYPEDLINEVESRLSKGIDIHTLVLWSKHPKALLKNPLYNYLIKLKNIGIQIYYQCTITGMGGKTIGINSDGSKFVLEPRVPTPKESILDLNKVIELLEDPLRIKLRIDPIVKLKNINNKDVYTNLTMVEPIIKETSKLGIRNYTFSFLENNIHNKVDRRFEEYEWRIVTPDEEDKKKAYSWLKSKGEKYNINIEACCVPGLMDIY